MNNKEAIELIQWYKDNISECDGSMNTSEELLSKFKEYKKEYNPEKVKRFTYGTVGYGVFSIIGDFYRMGRIEVYDNEGDSPFSYDEGTFCLPFEQSEEFEDWIMGTSSDYPMQISLGSVEDCKSIIIDKLGMYKETFDNKEVRAEYWKNKKY